MKMYIFATVKMQRVCMASASKPYIFVETYFPVPQFFNDTSLCVCVFIYLFIYLRIYFLQCFILAPPCNNFFNILS